MKRKIFTKRCIFFLLFLSYLGCQTAPEPLVFNVNQPKVGSAFSFTNTPFNKNRLPFPDSVIATNDLVLETGLIKFGKSNVTHILYTDQTNNIQADQYINYESDGDVSLFLDSPVFKWLTFPIKSRSSVEEQTSVDFLLLDSVIGGIHIVASDNLGRRYIDPIKDPNYPSLGGPQIAIDETTIISRIGPGFTQNDTCEVQWFFDAGIGYFYNVHFRGFGSAYTGYVNLNNLNRSIIGYMLK